MTYQLRVMMGHCLKYFLQYKEYLTLNLEHDFGGSKLETKAIKEIKLQNQIFL